MHVNPPPGLPALAILLPRPRSYIPSPRTPRTPSCGSSILFANSNRNSTDSWNSSNADDLEWDWKPEQVRLLSRTLDALPAHLVTPFNGPTPPSNLLDKIARGVAAAKGPVDWPHSLRATRAKLIELSRARAKEERAQHAIAEVYSDMEGDEPNYTCTPEPRAKTIGIRRPLYRQSSMDFITSAELKENDNIACLSDRLQRADRLIPNAAYHPYPRHTPRSYHRRLSSPVRAGGAPSLASPSTPSSSTLNSLSSFSTHHARAPHRASSARSSTSASSVSMHSSTGAPAALPDPRVQRVRRADSACGPAPPPKDLKLVPTLRESPSRAGIKRAPSFGAMAQEARRDRHLVFGGALKGPAGEGGRERPAYPSSDEEEKLRAKSAKKIRVRDGTAPLPESPASPTPGTAKRTRTKVASPKVEKPASPAPKSSARKSKTKGGRDMLVDTPAAPSHPPLKASRPRAMNLERNPSMFGAELPQVRDCASPRAPPQLQPCPTSARAKPSAAASPLSSPPGTPQKVKTLRRVRRLAPARRISFGSLVAPGEDADGEDEDVERREGAWERQRQRDLGQLGSAFQLS